MLRNPNGDKVSGMAYGCPVGCEYCVITNVESRSELWRENDGAPSINKAVTIINPPLERTPEKLEQYYAMSPEIFKGDIVGFCANSDPFWPRHRRELEYFLKKITPEVKLATCVTKWNVPDQILDRLAEIENFRLVVSITGLDQIEGTSTEDRLSLLERAKERGIIAYPIIHPYIAGMSDLSFLSDLKELGYTQVDVKGLRYDQSMNSWMPPEVQELYRPYGNEESLIEDGWRDKLQNAGIELKGLKSWYQDQAVGKGPHLSPEEAVERVSQVLKMAHITSSDTDRAVIRAALDRRL